MANYLYLNHCRDALVKHKARLDLILTNMCNGEFVEDEDVQFIVENVILQVIQNLTFVVSKSKILERRWNDNALMTFNPVVDAKNLMVNISTSISLIENNLMGNINTNSSLPTSYFNELDSLRRALEKEKKNMAFHLNDVIVNDELKMFD